MSAQRLTTRSDPAVCARPEFFIAHDRAEVRDEDLGQRVFPRWEDNNRQPLTEYAEFVHGRTRVRTAMLGQGPQASAEVIVVNG